MDIKLTPTLNPDGTLKYYDFSFTKGKLDVVDGIDEIKQRIIVNLQTYLGENFRDTSHGVDYFNNVFGYEVVETIPQDELKSAIIDTRGVTELKVFSFTRAPGSRTGDLNAQIITTQGELNLVTPIAL